jgi:hypothetical protein
VTRRRQFERIYREFAVVQFPIADLRALAPGPAQRLHKPSWPDPIAGAEFVRGVGSVRDRPRGTIRDWSGERSFCDAAGLLRFPKPHVRRSSHLAALGFSENDSEFRVIPRYRRLYSDGLSARIDVAFTSLWGHMGLRFPRRFARRTDREILSVPVTLPWRNGGVFPLGSVCRQLARRFAEMTTPHGREVRYDLVEAGTPMLLTEWHTDKGLPRNCLPSAGVHFLCQPALFQNRRMPSWSVAFYPHCDGNRARQVRGNLWRLHTERESLRSAIRTWRRDEESLDPRRLGDYLAGRLTILNREWKAGVQQAPVLDIAQQIESLAPPDVIDDLRRELRRQSLGILRSLDRLVEKTTGHDYATPVHPRLKIHVENGGHITMSAGDTYNLHGGAFGSAFGPNSHAHNRDFTVTPISAEELRQLSDRVAELTGHLPGDQQQELAQAHDELVQATNAGDQNPRRIHAAAERLMRFATTVGTVGVPLLEAVTKLLEATGLA